METACNLHGYWNDLSTNQFNFFLSPSARRVAPAESFLRRPGTYITKGDNDLGLIGYMLAFEHPYVSVVTSTAGAYVIDQVPPGVYDVVCWHEGLAAREIDDGRMVDLRRDPPIRMQKRVEVVAGGTVELDWTIEVPEPLRLR